jgi:hypothetical protein
MSVPAWAWAAFVAFVVAVLLLDLFVLHRRAQHVSLAEAAAWSAVWIAVGLSFGALLWSWRGGDVAQACLAGWGPAGQGLREETGEGRSREPVTVAGQASSHGTRGVPGD